MNKFVFSFASTVLFLTQPVFAQSSPCPIFKTLVCQSKVKTSDAKVIVTNLGECRFDASITQAKPNAYKNRYLGWASFSGHFWNYNGFAQDETRFHVLENNDGLGNLEAGYYTDIESGPVELPQLTNGSINCQESP